jgi:hypothetical protein
VVDSTLALELLCRPVGKGTRANVRVRLGDELIANETVDLASEKRRLQFAEAIAGKVEGYEATEIAELLLRQSDKAPAAEPVGPDEVDLRAISAAALDETPHHVKAEAEAMLDAPDLMDRLAVDLADIGIAGERELASIVYLTGVSRLLDKPLALIAQGPSSSGKSYVIEKAATLFPNEAVLLAKSVTPQALVYMKPGSLRHRWIVAGERSRVEDDDTAEATRGLREMISSGRLSKLVACKAANGQMESRLIEQDGPIAYTESTTLSRIFEEDRNRCLVVNTDERSTQTKAIMHAAARVAAGLETTDREAIVQKHHCLQRLLMGLPVVIPYALRLCDMMTLSAELPVESRRAWSMLLKTIEAVALLHQRQRDRDDSGRIVATEDDYRITSRLVSRVFARSVGEAIGDPARRFHERLVNLDELPEVFTAADIRKHIRASRSTVAGWLAELADVGAIAATESPDRSPRGGRPPRAYRLTGRGVDVGDDCLPSAEEVFPVGLDNRTNPRKAS